ncbi:MAG: 3-hydroxyacyl-CoA dehydrogenase NAD-binding domain-containing protein [bacterium]|nr:3-hydroxyacyl-CoA dehydrogenase NAD-binding domain-containing protein [bacterium]
MKIGIVGAGTMGAGIALTALYAGLHVCVYDIMPDALERARSYITPFLEKKGLLDRLSRLSTTESLGAMADREIVIEAALENRTLKAQLLQQLETICTATCIFASNTSTIPIAALANAVTSPGRVIGMHFFNPAPVMKLVEVIRTAQTDPAVIDSTCALALTLGKTPILVNDSPGFVVNRVARPYYLESLHIVSEGLASVEQVDQALESFGFRLGPFRLMDVIGIDVSLAASQSIYEATFHEPRFRPSLLQQQLVERRYLGRKTGRGFYTYADESASPTAAIPVLGFDALSDALRNAAGVIGTENDPVHLAGRVVAQIVNEAAFAVGEQVADMDSIDVAMRGGINFPFDVFAWARTFGFDRITGVLDGLFAHYHEERYRAAPLLRHLSRRAP